MTQDIELFRELLENNSSIKEFTKKSPTYPTQFEFNELNEECYDYIYGELKDVVPRQDLFAPIPKLAEECKRCWSFYLAPRNRSVRILDIKLGQKFQESLREFLIGKGIDCRRGDNQDKRYPDLVVYENGNIKAYLEVKYQSAPWLFAFKEEGSNKECYESSPALDTKKLTQQFELVESGEISVPVYYVYWLDFPCIKGVFFMDVYDMKNFFASEAVVFDRKERDGDFVKGRDGKKRKVSATKKIHPSIFQMKTFSELLKVLE